MGSTCFPGDRAPQARDRSKNDFGKRSTSMAASSGKNLGNAGNGRRGATSAATAGSSAEVAALAQLPRIGCPGRSLMARSPMKYSCATAATIENASGQITFSSELPPITPVTWRPRTGARTGVGRRMRSSPRPAFAASGACELAAKRSKRWPPHSAFTSRRALGPSTVIAGGACSSDAVNGHLDN